MTNIGLSRRELLALGGSAVLIHTFPLTAAADGPAMETAITDAFGHRAIRDERVTVSLPPISENGYSVPITVEVDSPMSKDDYIKQIAIFSPRNPLPELMRFHLSPESGLAKISSRIRLSGTQRITAIAETNTGKLFRGQKSTVVTLAACVIL